MCLFGTRVPRGCIRGKSGAGCSILQLFVLLIIKIGMFIIKHRKLFLGLSAFFVIVSIVAMSFFGLRFGIDFTGGSILEVEYSGVRPTIENINSSLAEAQFTGFVTQETGERGVIVRTTELSEVRRGDLLTALNPSGENSFEEKRFSLVGGVIGKELRDKAWIALLVTSLAIILYVAFAFRRVSEVMSSWVYGCVAVIALIHNVIIPTGVFAILGNYFVAYQIDVLFVTALLAIFGFSVNDTIVIFDRVRENLRRNKEERTEKPFAEVVGESVSQTMARSINISLAIVLVLAALYALGGSSTREFSLVLGLGVVFGTYSSICFAAPLLVAASRYFPKKS